MQALLGFTSEARWLRHARAQLRHLFPYLPQQPGYNKRLRAAASMIRHCIRVLAADTTVWTDDVWIVDSTPVECGRSRGQPSALTWPDRAEYRVLRQPLALLLGPSPAPGVHPAGPAHRLRPDRRQGRRARRADRHAHRRPRPGHRRPGQTLIGDKNYYGRDFEAAIAGAGIRLLRPARKGEPPRAAAHLFKPLRQIIESVNQTFKGQLDLEQHGGHTPAGVTVRVLQRILALTAAIWHNDTTGQPVLRSLVAYDH